jgi:quercetin dioxygenase-like cupin family protein
VNFSRRDLGFLLPALTARVDAQQKQLPLLPQNVYGNNEIPYSGDQQKKGRRFFYGTNHSGFLLEMHETILGPGTETHPPHKHEHEEIVILVEGKAEATLGGKKQTVDAGSVIYFGSNQMHNLRNIGSIPCRYYVVELRGKET